MSKWPLVSLREVLVDRAERPDPTEITTGKIKIVAKIRFNDGGIEFRSGADTKTGLIQCNPGDLLLSGINASKGAIAIWPEDRSPIAATIHYAAYQIDQNLSSVRYMWWYLRSQSFRDIISRSIPGGIKTELKPNRLLPVEIPLPPLNEQHAIVARLDAVAEKARQAEAKLDEIEADLNALCRGLVFSPPNGTTHLISMRELLTLRRPDVLVNREHTYHFAGVYSFGRGVFKSVVKSGSDFAYDSLSTLQTGNFTYPKLMAWEGALGVVPPECDGLVVSPEFPVFSVNTDIVLPETLDVYFRTPQIWSQLAEISTGTNQRRRRLQPAAFLDYKMLVPPMPIQKQLRETLRRNNEIKRKHQAIRQALNALLPSMLDRIFN